MSIIKSFAFLIHPTSDSAAQISSKEISLSAGKLFDMLDGVFGSGSNAHEFEVTFNPAADGNQTNSCRTLLIDFEENPSLATGLPIAERLQAVTDNRSGIGLLFLLAGTNGLKRRVVVSRFPTDQAVLAEISAGNLDVEFLEQVFIKRLSSYKALSLEHSNPKGGFWKGIATDRQAGRSGEHISDYWLKEFLDADFSETAAAGTRRLATALKQAVKTNPNVAVKSEIAHASSLAPAVFHGKTLSISDFCNHFGFSQTAKDTIKTQLAKPSLFSKTFQFTASEFKAVAPYRTVEMDSGAILTAPNENFEEVFERNEALGGIVEYKTTGKVSDQRLARK